MAGVTKFPKGHHVTVDFGVKRVTYEYCVRPTMPSYEQDQWCQQNFKNESWWYRASQQEFVFAREKDAMWFALKWG